jgi:hypothetical protein
MMSADGRGGYERSDFDYTQRFDSYDKKTSADIDRMKEKVRNEGGLGFLGHLRKKLTYTWKGSTFMANYYIRGNKFLETVDFRIFTAILHFTLLFGMAKSYLSRRKSDNDVLEGNFILKVTLMGLTVFLMLWEARCRYLVSFFLLFALL